MTNATSIQCHYDVLGVTQDSDSSTIKKAHRKLALQLHPDKGGDPDDFRRVQQAYECLSDATERRWYDEHRTAILSGWKEGGEDVEPDDAVLYNVMPYMHAGCYQGYDDDSEKGFYSVYQAVFQAIYDGEIQGRSFDPNQTDELLDGLLSRDFGTAESSWEQVNAFYQGWESFTSGLNFAWADPFNIMEAPSRRVRRAMEDENRKARRMAKKARNQDVLALVRFVKRRDPRVAARREALERQQAEKVQADKEAAVRRKQEAKAAREEWRQQAEEELAAKEEEDRLKGRVRLADLDDDYDYGGKKGKKGRKKKGKKKQQEEEVQETEFREDPEENVDGENIASEENSEENIDGENIASQGDSNSTHDGEKEQVAGNLDFPGEDMAVEYDDDFLSGEESSEEESEPDIWRCECCKKDFKSEGQMENHMKSKKHKAAFKKYQSKMAKLEEEMMNEFLDEGA